MYQIPQGIGWIEVICGSMFSGKTEELLRRLKRAQYAKQSIQVFKPLIDTRYNKDDVVSHSSLSMDARPVRSAGEILQNIDPRTQVVGIDEIQFFDNHVTNACSIMADRGIRVICAGLDQDYQGKPFGPMPDLLAMAEFVTKLRAVCVVCGNPGSRTQRLSEATDQIVVGATEQYEARCRRCHDPKIRE